MKDKKRQVMAEILHRCAAEFIRDNATSASLLTVTRVELAENGKAAHIYFTTLPENQEETALKFLERKLPEFKLYVREESTIGMVPHITFKIDYGERNRQRLDGLS